MNTDLLNETRSHLQQVNNVYRIHAMNQMTSKQVPKKLADTDLQISVVQKILFYLGQVYDERI